MRRGGGAGWNAIIYEGTDFVKVRMCLPERIVLRTGHRHRQKTGLEIRTP